MCGDAHNLDRATHLSANNTAMRVLPTQRLMRRGPNAVSADARSPNAQRWKLPTPVQLAAGVLNWCLWCFLVLVMLSQLLTAVRNTTTNSTEIVFGQEPSHGLYDIPGTNDDPYSDRLITCARRGRTFKAVSLNDALNFGSSAVEDSTGTAIHGYRVTNHTGLELSQDSKQAWSRTCRLMNSTLHGIFKACETLGYTNLTRDSLRIVDGLESGTLRRIPNAVPILIIPFWDNALSVRYAIPLWDGNACVFRLQGQFEDPPSRTRHMIGAGRDARETQTELLLGRSGGTWVNGWYEDTQGMRWYSDITAGNPAKVYGVPPRYIDLSSEKEFVCDIDSDCALSRGAFDWSADLTSTSNLSRTSSLTVSNSARFGIFYFRSVSETVVSCVYDLASLMSNASVVLLLVRWMLAMVALHRGFTKGVSDWRTLGIGSIANTSEFMYLPVMMLPRLKMILAAFYTVGCAFEGEQKALGDAWFVMYPSIVDFVLIYASLLNMIAKLLCRRMNDWIFPLTIMVFSGTHYFHQSIAELSLLKLGGRVNAQMGSAEFDRLRLTQMFSPDIALRIAGNLPLLLWWKLLVLSLSIVALICSKKLQSPFKRSPHLISCRCEQVLNIRACNVGGIGRTKNLYLQATVQDAQMLSSYELIRLGYVVVDNRYLMTMTDWWILTTLKPVRRMYSWWNHRTMVFLVQNKGRTSAVGIAASEISLHGKLISLQDSALDQLAWWDIDARSLL